MRLRLLMLTVACASAAAGCGGNPVGPSPVDAPSAPRTTSATTLRFVSGETGEPVAGAAIFLDGQRYTTDGAGQIRLDAPAVAGSLTVTAEPFLVRRTRASADTFSLWPKTSPTGLDESVTATLVYGCPSAGCTGSEALLRVVDRRVYVVPAPDLRADGAATSALEEAAERITAATGGEVVFSVWPSPPAGAVTVTVLVDPADPDLLSRDAGAVTKRYLGGRSSIVRSVVVVRSLELARSTPLLLHELGHAFGLGHSPRRGDVMWNGPELYGARDFTPRERLSVGLMLQRAPGNRFPDDDQEVTAGSAAAERVIACRGR
jgi:hypothetical protein